MGSDRLRWTGRDAGPAFDALFVCNCLTLHKPDTIHRTNTYTSAATITFCSIYFDHENFSIILCLWNSFLAVFGLRRLKEGEKGS